MLITSVFLIFMFYSCGESSEVDFPDKNLEIVYLKSFPGKVNFNLIQKAPVSEHIGPYKTSLLLEPINNKKDVFLGFEILLFDKDSFSFKNLAFRHNYSEFTLPSDTLLLSSDLLMLISNENSHIALLSFNGNHREISGSYDGELKFYSTNDVGALDELQNIILVSGFIDMIGNTILFDVNDQEVINYMEGVFSENFDFYGKALGKNINELGVISSRAPNHFFRDTITGQIRDTLRYSNNNQILTLSLLKTE